MHFLRNIFTTTGKTAPAVATWVSALCLLAAPAIGQTPKTAVKDAAKTAKTAGKAAAKTAAKTATGAAKTATGAAKTAATGAAKTAATGAAGTANTAVTPAPAAAPANPSAGTTAFNPQMVKYRAMLVGTEEKVNSLKEKIFRSKAQLMLLQEKLLHGVISTAKLKLVHENRMGGSFFLLSASYSIDGRPIFSRSDKAGSLNNKKKITLFQESISPGQHRVYVDLRLRGNGFGLFSYLRGYKFRIRSSYPFTAEEGKILEIKVVPYQKGWTTPLNKRAALKYEVKVRKLFAKRGKLQKALKGKK